MSPVLSAVLLQPCVIAAEQAMATAMCKSAREFREVAGVASYLDDCTIVAPPEVAAIGLRAFRDAVAERGWAVNMLTQRGGW